MNPPFNVGDKVNDGGENGYVASCDHLEEHGWVVVFDREGIGPQRRVLAEDLKAGHRKQLKPPPEPDPLDAA